MTKPMTLEQVRDALLTYAQNLGNLPGEKYRAAWAQELADAIDAAIKAPRVKVTDAMLDSIAQRIEDFVGSRMREHYAALMRIEVALNR